MSKIKRTRRLALTSLMATASVNLVACGAEQTPEPLTWDAPAGSTPAESESVEAVSYADPRACKTADEVPDAECDSGWRTAQADHQANAPRYGDKAACEAEYGEGRCETRSGGGFFTPLLAGMLLGRVLNGGGYRGGAFYQDRQGRLGTPIAGGRGLNPLAGAAARPTLRPQAGADNRAVSRGGFSSPRGSRGYGG